MIDSSHAERRVERQNLLRESGGPSTTVGADREGEARVVTVRDSAETPGFATGYPLHPARCT